MLGAQELWKNMGPISGANSIGYGGTNPHFYKWMATEDMVSRRTANKKLTKVYCPSRKRSPKRTYSAKKVEGTTKNFRTCAPTFKFVPAPLGPIPCDGTPIGLSRHHSGPLQWCSAYSGRFSSSVTSQPLYDDHHYHITAERAFSLQLRLCGSQERLQSICGSPGTASSLTSTIGWRIKIFI